MTNDQFQMTKKILNPNAKWETVASDVILGSFEPRHSFDNRHLDCVIVHRLLTSALTEL